MRIVGMNIEQYVGQGCKESEDPYDYEYFSEDKERHVLYGIQSNGQKIKITLSAYEDQCYSGYCLSNYAEIDIEEVECFDKFSYIPKELLEIDDLIYAYDEDGELIMDDRYNNSGWYDGIYIENKVFVFDENGGDEYYPNGSYSVDMDLFTRTPRTKSIRPVWIFKGESNTGKSYLSHLTDKDVYETDSSDKLPNSITEDIIVLGNKYKFTVEQIEERIFGKHETIIVNFESVK